METEDSQKRIGYVFWPSGTTRRCPLKSRSCVIDAWMEISEMLQGDACHLFQFTKDGAILLVIRGAVPVKQPISSEEQHGMGHQQLLKGPVTLKPNTAGQCASIQNISKMDHSES